MTLPRLHRAVLLLVAAVVVALVLVLTLLAGNRDRPEGERPEPASSRVPLDLPDAVATRP